MELEKTIAVRMTTQDQEKLKDMAWDKRMKFGTYVRYVLNNHIKDNSNDTSF